MAWLAVGVIGCSREETIPLKDGRTIRTWSTTYGTNHVAPGQFIQRLYRQLPPFPQRLLNACFKNAAAQIQEARTLEPALVLWTHPEPSFTNTLPLPAIRLDYVGRSDTASLLFYPFGDWGTTRDRTPGFAQIDRFPRRAPTVDVEAKLIEPGMRDWPTSSAVLHLRNPKPYTGPSWKPEALPGSRTHHGIVATLYELGVTNQAVTTRTGHRLELQHTWIRFEALDPGQRPLKVLEYELSDPGGNRLTIPVGKVLEKTYAHPFQAALFDDEPAWRLLVETELPVGDPEQTLERVEFEGLTDPPADDETGTQVRPGPPQKRSHQIPAIELSLFQFQAGKNPKVQMGVQGCPRGIRVVLEKAVDESGRIWDVRETGFGSGANSYRSHDYSMVTTNRPTVPAKSMDLTLRIYRTAIFEFHPPARFSRAGAP
jgi:hypothetical protein